MEPGDRLVADANTGWLPHEAMRVVRAVRDVDVYIEQPCLSYEECLSVRRHCDSPFVLDESIESIDVLIRAHADLAMDVVNLKISKLGGLTKTRQARDLCVSLGIAMTLEDSWGGDITTSAIAHLAHSTPPEFLFTCTDFNSYVTVSTATGAPARVNGKMAASIAPGLGVEPRAEVLGPRVVDISGVTPSHVEAIEQQELCRIVVCRLIRYIVLHGIMVYADIVLVVVRHRRTDVHARKSRRDQRNRLLFVRRGACGSAHNGARQLKIADIGDLMVRKPRIVGPCSDHARHPQGLLPSMKSRCLRAMVEYCFSPDSAA